MTQAFTRSKTARRACSLAAMLALCSQTAWAVMPTSYSGTLLDLSGSDGLYSSAVLNNLGQAAGFALDPITGFKRLAITGANGVGLNYVSDASFGATDWYVQGLNDSGVIVGGYSRPSATTVGALEASGFFTGANANGVNSVRQASPNQGGITSVAGINASGQMVAVEARYQNSASYLSKDHGQTWTALNLGPDSQVTAINDAGQLAGNIAGPTGRWPVYQAMVTGPNGASPQGLGTLGFYPATVFPSSRVTDINNSGQVTGYSNWSGSDNSRAFFADNNGQGMKNLGTISGIPADGIDFTGKALNDEGRVVGTAAVRGYGQSNSRAFVTDTGGTGMYDLNTFLSFALPKDVSLNGALAINESGQILAVGGTPWGSSKGLYLLTPSSLAPIPEASTVAYMALGLLGIASTIRRNKR